jgi:ribosomal protein L34E
VLEWFRYLHYSQLAPRANRPANCSSRVTGVNASRPSEAGVGQIRVCCRLGLVGFGRVRGRVEAIAFHRRNVGSARHRGVATGRPLASVQPARQHGLADAASLSRKPLTNNRFRPRLLVDGRILTVTSKSGRDPSSQRNLFGPAGQTFHPPFRILRAISKLA